MSVYAVLFNSVLTFYLILKMYTPALIYIEMKAKGHSTSS